MYNIPLPYILYIYIFMLYRKAKQRTAILVFFELGDVDEERLLGATGELAYLLFEVAHAARASLQYRRGHADVLVEGHELLRVAAGLGYVAVRGYHVLAVAREYLLALHVQLLGRTLVRAVLPVAERVVVALAVPDAVAIVASCGIRHLKIN